MKLSCVFPTYSYSKRLTDMAISCVQGFKPFADEVIISEDGGEWNNDLRYLADTYIYNKSNGGFTKNVNTGWKCSRGEYTAIISSDTRYISGNLKDLCIPGRVTSPVIVNQQVNLLAGSFFVVPKDIAEQRGLLNESMHTYWSDTDYERRIQDIFTRVDSVQIEHYQAQTVTEVGRNTPEQSEEDKKAYLLL